jgi:threonyl-tRNA synthetase
VRHIQQDDAHIFLKEDQIESEMAEILEMIQEFYGVFGFSYRLRLSLRPKDFLGDAADWDIAEAILKRVLDEKLGVGLYEIALGEGAFYGPKIDILMKDLHNREWQMGSIQLDFQLPRRFECRYQDADGKLKCPVVIHRAIYGSFERFIGIMLEHFKGALPFWLAPIQARFMPISERHHLHCLEEMKALKKVGLRVDIDARSESIGNRIRQAQSLKIPFLFVIGDREMNERSYSVRDRHAKQQSGLARERVISYLAHLRESKSLYDGWE